VAAFSWIVASAPEEKRGQMIGMLLSAAVVGALVGPALGGAAATFGPAPTFALVSVAGAVVFLWAAFTPAPEASRKENLFAGFLAAVLRRRTATGLLFIAFSPLIFSVFVVLAPLELSSAGWGAALISAVFLVAAGIETFVHPYLGRWFDRAGFRPPVLVGLLLSLAILIAFPLASAVGAAPLIALLVVLGAGAFYSPIVPSTAMFSRAAEKGGMDAALAFGATNFAWAFGYSVGAPLTGALADLGGNTLSCLVLAGVCLVALVSLTRIKDA
jgi:predicted MFS family arabinose efflux permease